jgi:hypothetical protein
MKNVTSLLRVAALVAATALLAVAARAEDTAQTIPMLEKHPLHDAKPGEMLRYEETERDRKTYFTEHVLAVREGEVLLEVVRSDAEGKTGEVAKWATWLKVPEFEPAEHQKFKRDEMVMLTVDGKDIPCRYVKIEELLNPPYPQPKHVREVWYSNEYVATGKVKESTDNVRRIVVAQGTMTPELLAERRKAHEVESGEKLEPLGETPATTKPADDASPEDAPTDEAAPPTPPAPPAPGDAPKPGREASCGSACGG